MGGTPVKTHRGWMTIKSRCGKVDIPIHEIVLRDGRLIFEGATTLTEDYATDEWSRCVIAGLDGVEYGDFPYHGGQIDAEAGFTVHVTFPTGVTSTR